ncbi:MAG: sugar phosphate nucleotidyltransferase [Patescibacteria group bacterium]
MRALILAAGFGTRLQPITNKIPKALVEIKGKTFLERAILYLQRNHIEEILINTHHFAEQIQNFLKNKKFGIPVRTIFESEILDTGGAIKNTKYFLQNSDPFVVYNVDVITDLNLKPAIDFHKKNNNLATLLVKERPTQRPFIVDANNLIVGHKNLKLNETRMIKKDFQKSLHDVGFLGIHILSPNIFNLMPQENVFGATPFYLDLIEKGQDINIFDCGDCFWEDVGSLEKIIQEVEKDDI